MEISKIVNVTLNGFDATTMKNNFEILGNKTKVDIYCRHLFMNNLVCDCGFFENGANEIFNTIIEEAKRETSRCSYNLPFLIFQDCLELVENDKIPLLIDFIQSYLEILSTEPFHTSGKFTFTRFSNHCLRKLSNVRNAFECGRVHIILSKFVPPFEKSGLNLTGAINSEVVDFHELEKTETQITDELQLSERQLQEELKAENFYEKFWLVQGYLNNPMKLVANINTPVWTLCTQNIDDVISWFHRQNNVKLTPFGKRTYDCYSSMNHNINRAANNSNDFLPFYSLNQVVIKQEDEVQFEDKYKTNSICRHYPNSQLLEKQVFDSKFQRQIFLQIILLIQTIESCQKVYKYDLTSKQKSWLNSTSSKVYTLLNKLDERFSTRCYSLVKNVLQKEKYYVEWKEKGCQFMSKNETSINESSKKTINFFDYDLKNNEFGKSTISHLWENSMDNMDACLLPQRTNLPEVNKFFEKAIQELDPSEQIEDEYKLLNQPTFQWKGLRMLSKNTVEFFSTPFKEGQSSMNFIKEFFQSNKVSHEVLDI